MSQNKARAAAMTAQAKSLEGFLKEQGVDKPISFLECLSLINKAKSLDFGPEYAGRISTIVSYGSATLKKLVAKQASTDPFTL